jgi:haloalkane dehalogenase
MPSDANWRSLYPFESHELRLDGAGYHYLDEGQGEPLLLVHGNPTWSFYWRELISELRGDFRLIAVDHVGCGLSDKPANYDYRLEQHVANLVELVEHLDLRDVTLVGHDWGGAIGLGVAMQLPDRFSRFVLLNTGAWVPESIPWRIRACRMPLLGRIGVQGLNLFAGAALWMAVEKRRCLSPAAKAGLLAPYGSWSDRTAIYNFVMDIPSPEPRRPAGTAGQASSGTRQTDSGTRALLHRIEQQLPTLSDRPFQFIWGMKDWCFSPACLERFLESLPEAEVLRLEDVGHWVMEEAPQQVVATVREFLANHPLPIASQ